MVSVGQVTKIVNPVQKAISQRVASKTLCTAKTVTSGSSTSLPDFLYHLTTESNLRKILSSGELRISSWEQSANGCPGVYMIDKNNFFKKWLGFKMPEFFGDFDIGKLLLSWINNSSQDKLCAIKISTAKINNANLKFRPYYTTCKEAIENLSHSRICKEGLPLSDLPNYITKEPVEYVYTTNIPTSMFAGVKTSKSNELLQEQLLDLFG